MSLRRLHSRSINHIDNGTHAEHSRSKKFTNKNNPRWMRSLLQNVPLIYGVTCGTGSSDAVSFILLSAGMERIVCECDCGRQSPPLSLTHLKSKKLSLMSRDENESLILGPPKENKCFMSSNLSPWRTCAATKTGPLITCRVCLGRKAGKLGPLSLILHRIYSFHCSWNIQRIARQTQTHFSSPWA